VNDSPNQQTREEYNRDFFNRWAREYDHFRISRWFRYTQELTLQQLDWRPDGKLLDVGCGTGHAVVLAASRLPQGKACGIDVSPAMVGAAISKIPRELAERVEFREAGAEHIPYDDSEFDYVICTNSFHHYHEPQQALGEMRRVLKAGGALVIFENAPDLSLYTWAWDKVLRMFEKGHVRYYPSSELGNMIKDARFDDVKLRVFKNGIWKHGKLFASIQVWAARVPVKSNTNVRMSGE
jgi:ubiquinone/menaquinone biosynthesis C-methylase UbiE